MDSRRSPSLPFRVPFQLQVVFTDVYGRKHMRVYNHDLPLTDDPLQVRLQSMLMVSLNVALAGVQRSQCCDSVSVCHDIDGRACACKGDVDDGVMHA